MTLIYDGVDLSGFTTKYGFSESVRVIEGPAKGTSISGLDIPDVVAIKFDPTFVLRPMTPAQVSIVWTLVKALPINTYKPLQYDTADGVARSITAKLVLVGSAEKALENRSRTLFGGISITFAQR